MNQDPGLPSSLSVYYCPICKVGTGDRMWHPVGRAGLIPQTQEEHDCVKIDVIALLKVVEAAKRVTELYPTVAGTSILIKESNRHVPRNPWDEVADAVHGLASTLNDLS